MSRARSVRTSCLQALVVAIGLLPFAASAQEAELPGKVLVEPRLHASMVAVGVHVPLGTAADPTGMEGTAFLAALLLEDEGTRRLEARSARIEATANRDGFLVTLLAPAGEWEGAWRELVALLEARDLSEADVLRVRDRQHERLSFEIGAPGREFERERDLFLLGAEHPGARPGRGTPEGLADLDPGAPLRFLREHADLDGATVAVVGPVTPSRVAELIGRPVTRADGGTEDSAEPEAGASPDPHPPADTLPEDPAAPPAPTAAPLGSVRPAPLLPPTDPEAPPAWTRGGRVVLDRDLTSTWISVGWPLPTGTPHVLEDFLAHVVSEALNPSPPEPGLYRAVVEVVRLNGAPVLIVDATVDPRATTRWENRLLSVLEQVDQSPPTGAFFDLARRRYRATRLLEQAYPEARARWLARRDALDGEVPAIPHEVWGLTREGLAALASARGEPRILVFGPEGMIDR